MALDSASNLAPNVIEIRANGLVFEADARGERGQPLVLLLHGFPQTRHSWRNQLGPLADAGYYAVAPDQRGYSPLARPEAIDAYSTDALVGDALQMALAHIQR